jgi:hypothetical protein
VHVALTSLSVAVQIPSFLVSTVPSPHPRLFTLTSFILYLLREPSLERGFGDSSRTTYSDGQELSSCN